MNTTLFGHLNGHSVGIIMRELVRRAIIAIRNQRQLFEIASRGGHNWNIDDIFASADKAAEGVYVTLLRECFPDITVIAGEDSGSVEISQYNGKPIYFTVEPLDGTRAFIRRESTGVGTMIALVHGNNVLAAFVGDVNAQEIYGFGPGSMGVEHINEFNVSQPLGMFRRRPLLDSFIMLGDREKSHSVSAQAIITTKFRNVAINSGSIGIWCAKLWKGEVGAGLILPGWETPWDASPVVGISHALGYAFFRPVDGHAWERYYPRLCPNVCRRKHEILVIHQDNFVEFFGPK